MSIEAWVWATLTLDAAIFWWVGRNVAAQPPFNQPGFVYKFPFLRHVALVLPFGVCIAVTAAGFLCTTEGWWVMGASVCLVGFGRIAVKTALPLR